MKLKYITDYCKERKIAMSNNEETIMSLDMSKLQHELWKNSVSEIFDKGPDSRIDQEDELIDIMKNFDKMNLTKEQIVEMLERNE